VAKLLTERPGEVGEHLPAAQAADARKELAPPKARFYRFYGTFLDLRAGGAYQIELISLCLIHPATIYRPSFWRHPGIIYINLIK